MTKIKPATFAARLRSLRESAGLTQAELATRARLTRVALGYLERGLREPAWDTVCRLAQALQVSTESFRS